jgi:TPR repeat protein
MQNKFNRLKKSKILLLPLLCSTFLLEGCIPEINKNMTILESRRSYIEGDAERAYHLTELLAYQCNPEAMYAMGYMHYYGVGAPQNQKLALAWFKEANKKGSEPAKKALERIALAQGLDSIESFNHPMPN